jgi:hypothetical protein
MNNVVYNLSSQTAYLGCNAKAEVYGFEDGNGSV